MIIVEIVFYSCYYVYTLIVFFPNKSERDYLHMNQYTEWLNYEADTLSPDDDEYEKKLLQVAELFRGFDEALTAFMKERGYMGDRADTAAKTRFLTERFRAADIKPPRNIEKWFVPIKTLNRKTIFQLCFAFGLNVNETNDFFRRVRLERSFDCHTISETIYYFCMSNNLSYSEAQEIIDRIHVPETVKSIPDSDVLYTDKTAARRFCSAIQANAVQ